MTPVLRITLGEVLSILFFVCFGVLLAHDRFVEWRNRRRAPSTPQAKSHP